MIDELDRKPLQVYLATVIGQLTVSRGEEFGIDLLQKFLPAGQNGIASSQITSPRGDQFRCRTGTKRPDSYERFPLPTGLTILWPVGNTLNAYVRASKRPTGSK